MKLDFSLCEYYLKMAPHHWEMAQSALDFIYMDSAANSLLHQIQQAFFDYRNPRSAVYECRCLFQYINTFAPQYKDAVFSAVFAVSLPKLLVNLRAECPDENILQDTLLDYSLWAKEYEADTGREGIGNYQWLAILFSQKIYRLGRLQYEQSVFENPFYVFQEQNTGKLYVIPCGGIPVFEGGKPGPVKPDQEAQFVTALSRKGNTISGHLVDTDTAVILLECQELNLETLNLLLAPGMPVLNIHIPRSGPLEQEQVDASLSQAVDFFHNRDYPVKLAICESWLLDPAVFQYAANSEKICSFQRRFSKYPLAKSCSDAQFRIFGKCFENTPVQELPTKTSLQRGFKSYLLNGGRALNTGGILLLNSADL